MQVPIEPITKPGLSDSLPDILSSKLRNHPKQLNNQMAAMESFEIPKLIKVLPQFYPQIIDMMYCIYLANEVSLRYFNSLVSIKSLMTR